MSQNLTLDELKRLVDRDAVAIRGRAVLEPAGGPGDKVFPPSHSVDNRMEEALQSLWAERRLALPVIEVDMTKSAPDVGKVTSLTAPHRVADALLRDSLVDGTLFRYSKLGRSFTDATVRNAGPLFNVCPTCCRAG